MAGIYDQFNASQANNGISPPNPQVTRGAPGFPVGSWGNQPPNLAGGLQQFLASRGMQGMPQQGGIVPPGGVGGTGGVMGAPDPRIPPTSPFLAPVARGVGTVPPVSTPVPIPPITGAPPMAGAISGGGGYGMPSDVAVNTGMLAPGLAPGAQQNLAGGMRPYLGG